MLLKIFYSIFLVSNLILCSEYDDIIQGNLMKFFGFGEKQKNTTYLIQKESNKKYFEINNYAGRMIIKKENSIIFQSLYEEKSFYFEHDSSNYYLIFENTQICGFEVLSSSKEFDSILTSEMKLKLLKQKSYEIIINNNETSQKLIYITIPETLRIKFISGIFEENGEKLNVDSYKIKKSDGYEDILFYVILSNKLKFFLTLETKWYSTISQISEASIYLSDKIQVISGNYSECLGNNFGYYQLNFNSYSHCEISMSINANLYFIESNNKKTKITSITTYDSKLKYLLLDSTERNGCFSIIFKNEKNSVDKDTDFNLILFSSRDYNMTIINSKSKFIEIGFKKNYYFNLTHLSLLNQKSQITSLYIQNDYYIFQFPRNLVETLVQLHFQQIDTLYREDEKVNFYYKSLDDIININKNYFECIKSTKHFLIKDNNGNKYINFTVNSKELNYLNINGSKINNMMQLTTNKTYYLNIFATEKQIICFNTLFLENERIQMKIDEKKNFIVTPYPGNIFEFELKGLQIDQITTIEIEIDSNIDNIYIYKIIGGEELKKNSENKNLYEIIPKNNIVQLIIEAYSKSNIIGNFNLKAYITNTEKYRFLIKISNICSYICFIFVFIVIYIIYTTITEKSEIDIKKGYEIEKLVAVYLCKKMDLSK